MRHNRIPQSAGIPPVLANDILVVPFNEPELLRQAFEQYHQDIAVLILEPINYDAGCLLPAEGYIELCRQLCDEYDVILFFDEVLTAFRMALGWRARISGSDTRFMCAW